MSIGRFLQKQGHMCNHACLASASSNFDQAHLDNTSPGKPAEVSKTTSLCCLRLPKDLHRNFGHNYSSDAAWQGEYWQLALEAAAAGALAWQGPATCSSPAPAESIVPRRHRLCLGACFLPALACPGGICWDQGTRARRYTRLGHPPKYAPMRVL